jgi:TolB protein
MKNMSRVVFLLIKLEKVAVMKRIINVISILITMVSFILPLPSYALLSMELTQGVSGAIPIAILPFGNVSGIVSNDLQNSGRFKVSSVEGSADNVVRGNVETLGDGRYQVNFQLLDKLSSKGANVVLNKKYTVSSNEMRAVAHHISDLIYQHITGVRGVFSTKIAYIVVQGRGSSRPRYILEVSDQDGYNPHPLLNSPEPLMSPSWSPNGRQLAYVSFENRRAGIYLQDVATGSRRLLSEFPGVNGAPAWSPDGRKLAIVLSKSGAPNIYVMDIASHNLKQLTHDYYINTEPAWSPSGKSLLFTSNRSGGPQIYQINLAAGATSRLSYDGDYNARASYTQDGSHVVMIHRVSGVYSIAILDLDSGTVRELSGMNNDSGSPSVAPNGTMILYDTQYGGRSVLGMVSSDGRVRLVLPARNGEAQDPAWSPFLS